MSTIVASIATVLVVAMLIGFGVYSCTDSRSRYYAAMSECVGKGGTWIPTGDSAASYTGACVQ